MGMRRGVRHNHGMSFRQVELPAAVSGTLWLHSMPGRFEPWMEFLYKAQAVRLGRVVCLTPMHELTGLSPSYGQAVASGELPFRFMLLPMRNFGLAAEHQSFRAGIEQVADSLRTGESVLLHCAAGVGRTGTAAACVLKALGVPRDDALERVRTAGSDPQSAAQTGLVDTF